MLLPVPQSRAGVTAAIIVLAGLAGCLSWTGGRSWMAGNITDPPANSPFARPLNSFGPAHAQDSAPYGAARTAPADPSPTPAQESRGRSRLEAPEPAQTAPRLPEQAAPSPLEMDVSAPKTVAVGEPILYRLTIQNRGPDTASNVALVAEFDPGLEFPGQPERQLRQLLGDVDSGASRSLSLSLNATSPGDLCIRFTVTADTFKPLRREACVRVQAGAPAVDVSIMGPEERFAGSRAEFVVTVLNRSRDPIPDTRVIINYDSALVAREASTGVRREQQQLLWNLGTLQADERVQIQAEFDCQAERPARLRAVVESDSGRNDSEMLLSIRPAPQPVSLLISDGTDPVSVGESISYRVTVTNGSLLRTSPRELEIQVSRNIEAVSVTARRDGEEFLLPAERHGSLIEIRQLPELAPGATVVVTVEGFARAAGRAEATATFRGMDGGEPIVLREPSLVNPPVLDSGPRASSGR